MGMKYCKRKILISRQTILKVVSSFPVFERIRKNEIMNCGIMNCGVCRDPAALLTPWTDFKKTWKDQEILSILTIGIDNSL